MTVRFVAKQITAALAVTTRVMSERMVVSDFSLSAFSLHFREEELRDILQRTAIVARPRCSIYPMDLGVVTITDPST
jgi:hypothetical protein